MNNQLQFFEVDNTPPQKPLYKSKYQKWKYENDYRKSENESRCKNCKNLLINNTYNKTFYKCLLLGISSSSATDIRLSNVCNNFAPKNANCQLCKHLNVNNNGEFICGLDNDILDHEGIYCSRFEEYIDE